MILIRNPGTGQFSVAVLVVESSKADGRHPGVLPAVSSWAPAAPLYNYHFMAFTSYAFCPIIFAPQVNLLSGLGFEVRSSAPPSEYMLFLSLLYDFRVQ